MPCEKSSARVVDMIIPLAEIPIHIRTMIYDDLILVSDIERRSYEFPWSHDVFRDCLLVGYKCIVLVREEGVVGYGIMTITSSDARILNLCVDPLFRQLGYGDQLLNEILEQARIAKVKEVFLEVRPSNSGALSLYRKKGFRQVANRPAYYQSIKGREDASVFSKMMKSKY